MNLFQKISSYIVLPFRQRSEKNYPSAMANIVKQIYFARGAFYEPVKIGDRQFESARGWEERWKAIKNELLNYNAKSVLDIGCAEGFYVRLSAEELGCFAMGIDTQNKRIVPGELSRLHDQVQFSAIMQGTLDLKNMDKLPKFDVIFCLSVVHHIIRIFGYEYAVEFVNKFGLKANKAVIFEMGTSDESSMDWCGKLPEMPKGQFEFLKTFLTEAGYKNIRKIITTPAINKEAERILVVAEPLHA